MPTMLSESANGLGANSANAQSAGKPSACRLEHQALSCESSSVLRPALGLGPTLPTTVERCHTGLPKAHAYSDRTALATFKNWSHTRAALEVDFSHDSAALARAPEVRISKSPALA